METFVTSTGAGNAVDDLRVDLCNFKKSACK